MNDLRPLSQPKNQFSEHHLYKNYQLKLSSAEIQVTDHSNTFDFAVIFTEHKKKKYCGKAPS